MAPQGLANLTKSLACLQFHPHDLLARLVAAARERIEQFSPLELTNLLYGLSLLQWRDSNVYREAAMQCCRMMDAQVA